jgi:hypothetical protein
MTAGAFAKLLTRQVSDKERAQLHALRDELALSSDDAIWALLVVLENYCDAMQERHRTGRSTSPAQSSAYFSRAVSWHGCALFCGGLAVQTFLMAVSFDAGTRASQMPWLRTTAQSAWFARALTAPAGWMIFALALPGLALAAIGGWQVRRRDPALGWPLVIGSSMTAVVFAGSLWFLMRV